jgi:catechol 2,3-dioxygenase-like lactoylglutathione lyase family enzyme
MPDPIAFGPTVVAQVPVSDFGRAVDWFRDKLGFEADYTLPDIGWGELRSPIPGLTLGIATNPESAGKSTQPLLALSVDDIEASRAALEAAGVAFDGPTEEMPGMVKLATFRDPDGNLYHLAQTLGSPA